jgi:hypothetical protein
VTQAPAVWVFPGYLAIGLAALLLQVLDLGSFLTSDEANFWMRRSAAFLDALRTGNYAATAISTHPGVTTMWLGGAGIMLREALFDWGVLHADPFPTVLALYRLPVVLTHVVGILLGYYLLRRLLPPTAAALGALLWATDPFVIGYSRLLHTDALAGTFATLSLLAACIYWNHTPKPALLALSGSCAGLAVLSKSPALALLPAIGTLALASAYRRPGTRLVAAGAPLLAWGAIGMLTAIALWPALWAGPAQAFDQLRVGVEVEGAQPHMLGNFFLGRPDAAPGPLFYPVALALRLTPVTLLGLLVLPLVWRRIEGRTRSDMAVLACFALILIVALSAFPKKFNRYLVPAFPSVDILAAAGLAWGTTLLGTWARRLAHFRPAIARCLPGILLGGAALGATVNAAWWHPYAIAAFNQALGGAAAGARTFMIGWGEGFDQVADWLNQQPNITGVVTVSSTAGLLQPYLRRGAQVASPGPDGRLPDRAGYVVVYVRQVQDGELPPPFDQFYGHVRPLHTVRLHGVDYAWIYEAPPQVAHPLTAGFGDDLRLYGFELHGPPTRGGRLMLTLVWGASATPPADYTVFAHLLGPDGQRYAQVDLPIPMSRWQAGHFYSTDLPLTVPAAAPPGSYRLTVGVYDGTSGQRLRLTSDRRSDPALDGPDALWLTELQLAASPGVER